MERSQARVILHTQLTTEATAEDLRRDKNEAGITESTRTIRYPDGMKVMSPCLL